MKICQVVEAEKPAYMINTKPANTILVQSTPLVLRSIARHEVM